MNVTIDIDTGGTFTDGFVVRDGVAHTVKVLTTPHDLAVCFREVLAAAADALGLELDAMLRETLAVRYATTVGTNALLQRRGPRLGLLADDSVPADDGRAFGVDLFVEPAMVSRLPAGGDADAGEVVDVVRGLLEDGARGLVTSFGGDDPQTAEGRVRATFAERYPRHCLDTVPLLTATELLADDDVARRTATALFNAYVHPDVADYLYRAEDHLRDHGYRRPLLIVHNDGGCARVAKTVAAKTYNSGPMAGLLGGRAIARAYERPTLVTMDMGGTSLDIGIIRDGEISMLDHGLVEDVEIGFPLADLVPLGAGGGSIAWLDGGTLRVGPQSAGAKPGPACFGFGGEQPTVTDADVVLGILRPEAFLGGGMRIDRAASERALSTLAEPLGCTPEEAALRVRHAVHEEMGARLAVLLRERGIDPATTTVLAFGGNGPTHGAGIAQAAGVHDVLMLPFSPVFSAFGASSADVRHRYEAPVATADEGALRARALRDMRGEGYAGDEVEIVVSEADRDGVATLVVEATRELPHAELRAAAPSGADERSAIAVRWDQGELATAVRRREALAPGDQVTGPALLDSAISTCVVPPGWTLTIDERGAERLRFTGGIA